MKNIFLSFVIFINLTHLSISIFPLVSFEPNIVCQTDRNATRQDFLCTSKTCYNTTSGLVTTFKSVCYRYKNRIESMDERTRKLMKVAKEPVEATKVIIKTAWKDWLGLQFIEYLYQKTKFL